jgi:hypothetical protein
MVDYLCDWDGKTMKVEGDECWSWPMLYENVSSLGVNEEPLYDEELSPIDRSTISNTTCDRLVIKFWVPSFAIFYAP